MSTRCISCNKNLIGHPKIRFEGDVYCYKCAKDAVAEADRDAEEELAPAMEEYELQLARYTTWKDGVKSAKPDAGLRLGIAAGTAIAFTLLVADGKSLADTVCLFFFGLIIGAGVSVLYAKRKVAEWVRLNPQPDYPSRPSFESASTRVQLVNAESADLELPSTYRQQLLERDCYECQNCGRVRPAGDLEIHHIKSRAKGGRNILTNLITLCFDCHLKETWFGHSHYLRKKHLR